MNKIQKQILTVLQRAIDRFNENETYLIENDLCERCICSRFAMYIENAIHNSTFKEYTTDVEYDRGMGGNDYGKKILLGHDSYLDLIVHKRGYNQVTGYDNLFAVEMKKQNKDFEGDKRRLMALVDNDNGFGYRAGFAVRIISDEGNDGYGLRIEEAFYNEQDF